MLLLIVSSNLNLVSNIYQQLWNSDNSRFSVSSRDRDGKWSNGNADILLNEQVAASRRRDLDLAKEPLFYRVNDKKLRMNSTYIRLIKLLDNYIVNYLKPEKNTKPEKQEIEQFIESIIITEPLQIALKYIQQELNILLSRSSFKKSLYRLWFEPYTNYFGNKIVEYASGFEHIFVGEGKYHNNNEIGKISGYHSWVKFYLDEKNKRVNFFGHKYDLESDLGPENPYIVSLRMEWQHRNIKLFKNKGCFFVGTSPECEIAMATVAFYESLVGKFKGEKRRTTINNSVYDLVIYRNIEYDGNRGDRIRSFYPVLVDEIILNH